MRQVLISLVFPIFALLAGSSLVIQAALNATLRSGLKSWSWAALTSYLGGTVTMLMLIAFLRMPRPSATSITAIPWSAWTGGFFGAIYVVLSIVLLRRLGATVVVAFVVAGQILTSLVFDQYGLMGLARQPATPLRLFGGFLLVVAVVLIHI